MFACAGTSPKRIHRYPAVCSMRLWGTRRCHKRGRVRGLLAPFCRQCKLSCDSTGRWCCSCQVAGGDGAAPTEDPARAKSTEEIENHFEACPTSWLITKNSNFYKLGWETADHLGRIYALYFRRSRSPRRLACFWMETVPDWWQGPTDKRDKIHHFCLTVFRSVKTIPVHSKLKPEDSPSSSFPRRKYCRCKLNATITSCMITTDFSQYFQHWISIDQIIKSI